jgi:hypothetical protein
MVAKQPSDHYFLVYANLASFLIIALALYARRLQSCVNKSIISLLIVACLSSYTLTLYQIKKINSDQKQHSKQLSLVYKQGISQYEGYLKFYYYRSSSPVYALMFGNIFTNDRYGEVIQRVYPDACTFNIWTKTFFMGGKEIRLENIYEKYNGSVLLVGTPFTEQEKNNIELQIGFKLDDVLANPTETIYKVER